jgi:hypothetical protein
MMLSSMLASFRLMGPVRATAKSTARRAASVVASSTRSDANSMNRAPPWVMIGAGGLDPSLLPLQGSAAHVHHRRRGPREGECWLESLRSR